MRTLPISRLYNNNEIICGAVDWGRALHKTTPPTCMQVGNKGRCPDLSFSKPGSYIGDEGISTNQEFYNKFAYDEFSPLCFLAKIYQYHPKKAPKSKGKEKEVQIHLVPINQYSVVPVVGTVEIQYCTDKETYHYNSR